jgi:hypothetical protein
MKRAILLLAALAMMTGLFASVASADEEFPPHGHMLIHGVEFSEDGVTYRKCVDLANNRALPLHSHHERVHFGTAGQALFVNAGHLVVPTSPLSDIDDCAHLAELFGPPTK